MKNYTWKVWCSRWILGILGAGRSGYPVSVGVSVNLCGVIFVCESPFFGWRGYFYNWGKPAFSQFFGCMEIIGIRTSTNCLLLLGVTCPEYWASACLMSQYLLHVPCYFALALIICNNIILALIELIFSLAWPDLHAECKKETQWILLVCWYYYIIKGMNLDKSWKYFGPNNVLQY